MTLSQRATQFSARVSDAAGHPVAQILVLAGCAAWLRSGSVNDLTLILSIVAITLSQMILAADRRDKAAVHAKIDEIIRAVGDARDEFRGIERRSEAEIRALEGRP